MRVKKAVNKLTQSVRSIRTDKGISVSSLAANINCGVSESTIRRIEKASKTGYNPSFKTLVRLANGLKVNPVALLNLLNNNNI